MSNDMYPRPPGHKTFSFDGVTISSDFDSGNCSNVQKQSNNQYLIWIATDNPKNNYRTWFHFSIQGISKNCGVSFTIKNMQNQVENKFIQSRLLNEGLVPVYREQGSEEWKRVSEKVNVSAIQYNQGWIQWTFKHNFKSNEKHYFAFFYPWSNEENSNFLNKIEAETKQNPQVYFYRGSICHSLQGRPIEYIVISSNKNKLNKQDRIHDDFLLKNQKSPNLFSNKPGVVISARVHPGEVPGSHVMTGILKTLVRPDGPGKILRDQFVFYIFPILNPDGVARGHYRVDTNGINLNRCYINPSQKEQPSIYAIRKVIMHLHAQNKFHSFLDLHAHAARKGTFIYGNCSNQLMKQIDACIFPKLLSMNSEDFEYEGSNFTEKNMYSKDRGDHISKQGSGRVAMYKATKNAYCWTMECNYNISRVCNILEHKKRVEIEKQKIDENSLQQKLIIEYKQQEQVQAKQFFTIETYHKMGVEVCQTYLDLIEKNPQSRIDNPNNYFKSVINVKMNLAVALLRMAPNRFESCFKKIFSGLTNSENTEIIKNSLKALYFLVIKKGKILNMNNYVKNGDLSEVEIPEACKKAIKSSNFRTREAKVKSYNKIDNQIPIKTDDNKILEKTCVDEDVCQGIDVEFKNEQIENKNLEDMNCQQIETVSKKQGFQGVVYAKIQQNQRNDRKQLRASEFKLSSGQRNKQQSVGSQYRPKSNSLIYNLQIIRYSDLKIDQKQKNKQLPFLCSQKWRQGSKNKETIKKGLTLKQQLNFLC